MTPLPIQVAVLVCSLGLVAACEDDSAVPARPPSAPAIANVEPGAKAQTVPAVEGLPAATTLHAVKQAAAAMVAARVKPSGPPAAAASAPTPPSASAPVKVRVSP